MRSTVTLENTMDDLTEIFDSQTQGTDLDVELATAGQVLQKLAEEQNIDLDKLSDEDVADLLSTLLRGETNSGSDAEPTQTKEASAMTTPAPVETAAAVEPQTPEQLPELTYADVAVELAKVAAANNIDLNEVSREEYHEAFDALAAQLQDPELAEKRAAAEAEAQEKLAEADAIGRVMARSFMDEMDKAAAPNVHGESRSMPADSLHGGRGDGKPYNKANEGHGDVQHGPVRDRVRGATDKVRRAASGASDFVAKHVGELKGHYDKAGNAGKGLGGRLVAAAKGKPRTAAALAGTALLGTGAAAKGVHALATRGDKKKKSEAEEFEAEALELARQYLIEDGVNPDTGEKLAEAAPEATPEAAQEQDLVAVRAAEILKEAGWIQE